MLKYILEAERRRGVWRRTGLLKNKTWGLVLYNLETSHCRLIEIDEVKGTRKTIKEK